MPGRSNVGYRPVRRLVKTVSDLNTCSACGAHNPPEAEWCTLCFARFQEHTEPVVQPAVADPMTDQAERSVPGEQLSLIADDRNTWQCRYCEARVTLEESTCPRCQQSIYDSYGGGETSESKLEDAAALRWAWIPGAGHQRLGHGVLGVAIGFSVLLSALFGVVLLRAGRSGHGWVLIFITVATWLASLHDVLRIARNQHGEMLLRPRVLSVIAGVVFMVIVGASVSAQSAINQ